MAVVSEQVVPWNEHARTKKVQFHAKEVRLTVSGATMEIAMSRSFPFRSHGAEIVHGPVLKGGAWRIELVHRDK